MERRKFIRYIGSIGAGALVAPSLVYCSPNNHIRTKVLGANKNRGHLLRKPIKIPTNLETTEIGTLIVGGGISGLSTGYQLHKQNYSDFIVVELNDQVGGNSGNGENEYSKFPLGAHYLTLPNPENKDLITFLQDLGLILGIQEDGKIIYHEEHLCHAPDERLLYRGTFQEGLVPSYGISNTISSEISRFFKKMDEFKELKGKDEKYVFNIPLAHASEDVSKIIELDNITFLEYLNKENYDSEELRWFLDYCCRDDFGAGYDKVSALAGINYFAGRKANPANTIPSNVLTWPEGNGYLMKQLLKPISEKVKADTIVVKVEETENKIEIITYNCKTHQFHKYLANHVVMACPSYVAKHILTSKTWKNDDFEYKHHPWMVSSVVLKTIPEGNGLSLAWDNVKYQTKGLGYIYNQHQSFKMTQEKYVISVYLAFDEKTPEEERTRLFTMTEEDMKYRVIEELKGLHPYIEEQIESIEFQQWGHGMVTPYPGSFQQQIDFQAKYKTNTRVKLVHTDYAGYSVFEEGFARGTQAANEIVQQKA